jgi:hypothetical protein
VDSGGNLVDILAAGPRRTNSRKLDLVQRYVYCSGYM